MTEGNLVALFVIAIPVACIAWTVTHEEIFREPREWCAARSKSARRPLVRKFYYVFTCEYCFSHYVAAVLLAVTRYRLLFDDWRGYVIAGFSLVWIANVYMSFFGRLRLDIKHEGVEIAMEQETLASQESAGMSREAFKADADPTVMRRMAESIACASENMTASKPRHARLRRCTRAIGCQTSSC